VRACARVRYVQPWSHRRRVRPARRCERNWCTLSLRRRRPSIGQQGSGVPPATCTTRSSSTTRARSDRQRAQPAFTCPRSRRAERRSWRRRPGPGACRVCGWEAGDARPRPARIVSRAERSKSTRLRAATDRRVRPAGCPHWFTIRLQPLVSCRASRTRRARHAPYPPHRTPRHADFILDCGPLFFRRAARGAVNVVSRWCARLSGRRVAAHSRLSSAGVRAARSPSARATAAAAV
jgi:hypothetical protein